MSQSRILIVEDEPLIAMMLEDYILSLGHEVLGPCESVAETIKAIESEEFDLAILDVNLQGESVWPAATKLAERGIPFVLASGGHVEPPPREFVDIPLIHKPYTVDRVAPVIAEALA